RRRAESCRDVRLPVGTPSADLSETRPGINRLERAAIQRVSHVCGGSFGIAGSHAISALSGRYGRWTNGERSGLRRKNRVGDGRTERHPSGSKLVLDRGKRITAHKIGSTETIIPSAVAIHDDGGGLGDRKSVV